MRYGTAYFTSRAAAIRYYRDYNETPESVDRKLAAGEIHLGPPEIKPGERLSVIDDGARYAVESD